MTEELELQLVKKYPKILQDYRGDPLKTCMAFGIECDDGWYSLIDGLLDVLQCSVDYIQHPQVCALQIKEKFGLLRFYANGTDEYQDGIIYMAEKLSGSICEKCSACHITDNVNNRKSSGWYKTLCQNCYDKWI